MDLNLTIVVVGAGVLLAIALAVGLDRQAQQSAWRRIAASRADLNRRRAATREVVAGLCDECPYRHHFGPFDRRRGS